MGSRIGYCVESNKKRSSILRSQNPLGSIQEIVEITWKNLLTKREYSDDYKTHKFVQGNIDDGDIALRDDLDIDRAFASLVFSAYEPPFTSIHENTGCDIHNNGLIIIDCTDYKNWVIYQTDVVFNYDDSTEPPKTISKKKIARMDSLGFVWLKSKSQLEKIGEGLY
tara:strand:- start:204 stop:704 length:501 start_codon:yes stop_codon:yes gene_type:complete